MKKQHGADGAQAAGETAEEARAQTAVAEQPAQDGGQPQTSAGETEKTASGAAGKLRSAAARAGARIRRAAGKIRGFCKKHKVLSALIAAVLVAAIAAACLLPGRLAAASADELTYVRTVTLAKTSLDDTISATGSVESASVSNVTTKLNYTVKTINVQVGDEVKAGDVILTLDTSELSDKIAKAKQSLADATDKAYASYTSAVSEYEDAVNALSAAKSSLAAVQTDYTNAKTVYDAAVSAVAAQQSACTAAQADAAAKKTAMDLAWIDFANAVAACTNGHTTSDTVSPGSGCSCESCYSAYAAAEAAYNSAVNAQSAAGAALDAAKTSVNYAAAESAYNAQKAVYDPLNNACTAAKNALAARTTAKTTAYNNYVSSKSSDTLDELYEEYENCTLVAATAGKVTSVSATVGSAVNGTAATIQDTDDLIVSISIAEYDVKSVEVGMKCIITSDATDGDIEGEVSMISPVANSSTGMGGGSSSSSTFDAEVAVLGSDSGLLVGMNAKVEIILSSIDDVYSVPYDAVGTDENGNSIVYVMTNDDALNPVFEAMTVTTGESNDYYIEISGDGLREGMVIRASAVEEEAVTDTPTDSGSIFSMFGGQGGAPSGGSSGGGMPSGGGAMPSGGSAPSGGGKG
ncbi:MAG: efflux RND transporter periplasmic adaptor subunit [Oscillospiraceae bacterium]|nr:efflux RND transporter periplasmic adaptor subunit [Oscillospiraceae bacterium]